MTQKVYQSKTFHLIVNLLTIMSCFYHFNSALSFTKWLLRASRRAKRRRTTALRKFQNHCVWINAVIICKISFLNNLNTLSQTCQYPAHLWWLAESDFEMLQGEHREDSVLFEYRLGLHAVCGQRQEGANQHTEWVLPSTLSHFPLVTIFVFFLSPPSAE